MGWLQTCSHCLLRDGCFVLFARPRSILAAISYPVAAKSKGSVFKGVSKKPPGIGLQPEPATDRPPLWRAGMIFLLGMACMAVVESLWPLLHHPSPFDRANLEVHARSDPVIALENHRRGPWGEFEYTRLSLEQPHEFLPDTTQPLPPPCWFFGDRSRQQVGELLSTAEFTEKEKRTLLDPAHCQAVTGGYSLFPPTEMVLKLSRAARERLYSVLAEFPANSAQCHAFRFRPEGFEAWAAETGLGAEQLSILRQLLYLQGGALCFCDGAVVQSLFSAQDFNRFVKELYEEKTFLMRLRVSADTDRDALVRYWGRAGRAQVLRPLLESMAQVPGGTSINISYFLPPFARIRLYTFADPKVDPTADAQNCFWTAMNFFRDKPDDRFLDPAHVRQTLASDYEVVSGPPLFGDVIAVQRADGEFIHLCVYLADEVVFTKNGHDFIEPWVLMKLPDMLIAYQTHGTTRVTSYRPRQP